jgi:hypothetical protein
MLLNELSFFLKTDDFSFSRQFIFGQRRSVTRCLPVTTIEKNVLYLHRNIVTVERSSVLPFLLKMQASIVSTSYGRLIKFRRGKMPLSGFYILPQKDTDA